MGKRKSSGVGEFAVTGTLMKTSRNTKINSAGDTMLLASLILLIGQLIKLCFIIPYQVLKYTLKIAIWSCKIFAKMLKEGLRILKILGDKCEEYNKKNRLKKTLN
ncbi:hypothetical protein KYB31_09110 [Clostridium felsineum]|uniref:hypothetical protein n=1 Tax=Clostridium felsineum TaxID=36839 RepID=UPI00214D190C|nr:hypothetical protein [Clostridium felsineum]MCR3759147.1 hypothetical protein [Clostridium felsineum]